MLKFINYGQNDGNFGPDVALTGDPGTDNTTLLNAGYLGGKVVSLKTSATTGRGTVLVPTDSVAGNTPYGFLINGPGEFAGAIGPSGSGKIGVTRALPEILVDSQAYVASPTAPYTVGAPLYVSTGANAGKVTADLPTGTGAYTKPIGICTHLPSASNPWLGIASLL